MIISLSTSFLFPENVGFFHKNDVVLVFETPTLNILACCTKGIFCVFTSTCFDSWNPCEGPLVH